MVQYVKQGDIFGRLGSGIGQGLASQLPEEIQRGRMQAGLKNFEKESESLSPMQQLARLSAIPGITPQTIQSFSELAKVNNTKRAYENTQNAYRNKTQNQQQQGPNESQSSPDLRRQRESDILDQASRMGLPIQTSLNAQGAPNNQIPGNGQAPNQNAYNQSANENLPNSVGGNPFNPNLLPKAPWTPAQRDQRVLDYLDQGFTPDQAQAKASDDEARELSEPGVARQQFEQLEEMDEKTRNEFTRQLEKKLQKKGDEVFRDISGPMLNNAERGILRDLANNPKANYKDVVNTWTNRLLQVARAKTSYSGLAQRTGNEAFIKGSEILDKLNQYSKIFRDAENSEEFFDLLRITPKGLNANGEDVGFKGFGLSPGAAAVIAFKPQPEASKVISSYQTPTTKWGRFGPTPPAPNDYINAAKKTAIQLEGKIADDDSILAIARELSNKDPNFNQNAFFNQLRKDQNRHRFNGRQKLELAEGEKDIIPFWSDLKIFKWGEEK